MRSCFRLFEKPLAGGLVLALSLVLAPPCQGLAQSLPEEAQNAAPAVTETGEAGETPLPPAAEQELKPVALKASLIKTDKLSIDLASVIRLVAEQNLTIAQSQKNTEVLQSRLRQSEVSLLPSITASAGENWQRGQAGTISGSNGGFINSGAIGGASSSTRRSSPADNVQRFVQLQAGVSWTIYPGGRDIYRMLAAKRRKVSADFLLKGTVQEQLSSAVQQYYKLLAAYQQKGVVIRSLMNVEEQVRFNQAKVKVGKGIPLDLSQAQTSYARLQSDLVSAESVLLTAEQTLLNTLNLDPDVRLLPTEVDTLKHTLVPETFSVNRLMTDAIAVNPAIRSGEQELKALGYDYKAVRSDLIPSVTLNTSVRGSGNAFDALRRTESIGFTVNTTLLQNMGLLVPFQMQERKKLMEQQVLAQKQRIRDVQSQVMTAFLNSENYDSAIEAATQALSSAEESYRLAFGRFKAGYGVYLDVLTADAQLADARNTLAQAVLNYNQAQVQLVQATGLLTSETLTRGLQPEGISSHGDTPAPKP